MTNYEEQVHKEWAIVTLIALAVALVVIFYLSYSSSAYGSETIVEAPVQSGIVECDTDLDCQLKNPEIFNEENEE